LFAGFALAAIWYVFSVIFSYAKLPVGRESCHLVEG